MRTGFEVSLLCPITFPMKYLDRVAVAREPCRIGNSARRGRREASPQTADRMRDRRRAPAATPSLHARDEPADACDRSSAANG
jgi:hypothetical protein